MARRTSTVGTPSVSCCRREAGMDTPSPMTPSLRASLKKRVGAWWALGGRSAGESRSKSKSNSKSSGPTSNSKSPVSVISSGEIPRMVKSPCAIGDTRKSAPYCSAILDKAPGAVRS